MLRFRHGIGATVAFIDIDGIDCAVQGVTVTDGNVQAKGCPDCVFTMFDTLVMDGDVQIEGFDHAQAGTQSGGQCLGGDDAPNVIVNGDLQMKENEKAIASCNQLDNGDIKIEKNTSANIFVNNADNGNIQCVENMAQFASANTASGENTCP